MKYLIRFEDTYGLCDIFCAVRGINYLELNKCASIQMIDSNTYINFGLGIQSCLSFNKSEVAEISRLKIDQILVVLDVDDLSGNKNQLLQDYDFEFQFNRTKKKFVSAGCGNVQIKFILAAYAAETLELYQYIVPSLFVMTSMIYRLVELEQIVVISTFLRNTRSSMIGQLHQMQMEM